MAYDRKLMIEAMIKHAEGLIQHKPNEVYHNAAGVGEHPDILEVIEKELNIASNVSDQIEMPRHTFDDFKLDKNKCIVYTKIETFVRNSRKKLKSLKK